MKRESSRPRTLAAFRARNECGRGVDDGTCAHQKPCPKHDAHVCFPSAAVSMSLSLGMRSSVRETCTCGRTTAWISNHLGKVVALPSRGES